MLPIIPPLTLEKLGLTGKANQVKNMHMLDPKTPSKQALLNEEKENNYSAVDNRSSFGSEIILGQDYMLNGGSSFLKQNDDSYLKSMHSIVNNIKIGVDYETPRLQESEVDGEGDILFP